MNATEALKQARELLRRVLDCAETDYNFPEDVPVFAEARAFLALPSPVEEGTWNEAVETAAKVALDADVPGYEWTGAVLISGRIRRLRRDTSKPEEKRYTMAELELAFDAMVEARTGLDFYETDGSAWDAFRAALTGEGGHG